MASGRDPEANWQEVCWIPQGGLLSLSMSTQIIQIQVDAGLNPGTPLSETLDHLLRPIFQQDGSTPGQPPYHASQQVRLPIGIYCRDHPNILADFCNPCAAAGGGQRPSRDHVPKSTCASSTAPPRPVRGAVLYAGSICRDLCQHRPSLT
jgi:hypothetical protein